MNSDKGHYNYNDEQGQVRVKKKIAIIKNTLKSGII
jgi:hypothetical protein